MVDIFLGRFLLVIYFASAVATHHRWLILSLSMMTIGHTTKSMCGGDEWERCDVISTTAR